MSSRENIFKTKDLVDRSSWKECTPTARALHCLFTNRVSLRSVDLDSSLTWNIVHLLQSSRRCIIAHYGTFRKCWDSVILTAILYVATIVPYNAAFFKSENKTHTITFSILMFRDFVGSCHQQKVEASLVFDGLIEAIFILGIIFWRSRFLSLECKDVWIADIFFNFHITYVNVKGEVVFDRKSIALKYLKGTIKSVWQTSIHFKN